MNSGLGPENELRQDQEKVPGKEMASVKDKEASSKGESTTTEKVAWTTPAKAQKIFEI